MNISYEFFHYSAKVICIEFDDDNSPPYRAERELKYHKRGRWFYCFPYLIEQLQRIKS